MTVIGPTKVDTSSIKNLPPLILGGSPLNTIYNSDPLKLPTTQVLDKGFERGLLAIDTSPYYGVSEEVFGRSLEALSDKWKRESYYICSKAGRYKDGFDYSRANIRKSVHTSLARLKTSYIDLLYCHDIEFVKEHEIFEALKELRLLQKEGVVKNIGISGYPLAFLVEIAQKAAKDKEVGALDVVLTYCNGNLQNDLLYKTFHQFYEAGVKLVLNGSILCMSLLRSQKTHEFHPASKQLKDVAEKAAKWLKDEYNMELAELATRVAIEEWLVEAKGNGILLGVSNVEELDSALDSYAAVKQDKDGVVASDKKLAKKVREILGPHFNETWASGIH